MKTPEKTEFMLHVLSSLKILVRRLLSLAEWTSKAKKDWGLRVFWKL